MMRGYHGGFGGLFMGILLIIIVFIIIYFAFPGIGRYRGGHHMGHNHKEDTPLDELKTRYAKGEISKKEFESMKQDIM